MLIALESNAQIDYGIKAGAYISGKMSSPISPMPVGRQADFNIINGVDFGLTGLFRLSVEEDIYFKMDIGIANYDFLVKNQVTGISHLHQLQYYNLAGYAMLNNFVLGLNLGLPSNFSFDGSALSSDDAHYLYEVRFGYSYPVYARGRSEVNLYANVGIMLNTAFRNFTAKDPMLPIVEVEPDELKATNANNPRIASLQIGVIWLMGF